MSSFSSNAILAKARAMYSKRLLEKDYEELLKQNSIKDIVNYLKVNTSYNETLKDIKDNEARRGQLEALLDKEVFNRLTRLMRYAPKKDMSFYRLGVTELEIHLLLTKIRLIISKYYTGYEIDIPDYLNKYAHFNIYELMAANSYETVLEAVKGTKYYPILERFKPKDETDTVDTNLLELEFKQIYYREYIDTINKMCTGKKRKDLLTMVNTSIELQNITKIYRLKKYFDASPSQIRGTLFLEYSRIPQKMMDELIDCEDADILLQKLAESPYKLYVGDDDFVYIEYYTEKIRYHLAKRFMRFSTNSQMVYLAYKFVYQIEIDNLKHIIEGLRYGENPQRIQSMLIY